MLLHSPLRGVGGLTDMKKTFQKFQISIPPAKTEQLSEALRDDFSNIDAVFITKVSGNIENLTVGMKVGGVEILPDGVDAALLTFNGQYPVKDAAYSFAEDSIPAKSSELEFRVNNESETTPAVINVYCILSNR